EPAVPRQQWPVQVRPVDPAGAAALVARHAVVAEASEHAAERLGARVEIGAAGVVLEAGEGAAGPVAGEEHVADHAPVAGDRLQRQQADPRQLDAGPIAIEATEELVAAADGKDGGAGGDRLVQRLGLRREVERYERLLAILAAADVEEVDLSDRYSLADRDRAHLELEAARACARREHRDVAPVGIDVEVVGIEVADANDHAACSQ